jgi:CRP-like cAMP-binding protein
MSLTKITSLVLIGELRTDAGLNDEEINLYLSFLRVKYIGKKEHLLTAGETCTEIAYVNKGCLRRYIMDEHSKETILNFALEDYWTGDLESFINQKPSIYYVQALEQCELLMISRENFQRATEEIPNFKVFHDNKVRRNHYSTLKSLSIAKAASPEEKYISLMNEQPQLFQRIPQHYIAAYLGIEPESLSRLRKRIVIKPHIS